jgi:nucleoside-diphosphate-sugar epimerase
MTKVLIIGANGFLGKNLVQQCLDRSWTVDVAVNKSADQVPKGINHLIDLKAVPVDGDDAYKFVFNTAAFIPYNAYNTPDERLLESNIQLPYLLHKRFANTKIIYASSVSVFSAVPGAIVTEQSPCDSPTLYGRSKLAGELITAHHAQYAIVRFSSLYGVGMYSGTFIPAIVNKAKTGKLITLLGDGSRKQNYLHIRDAANFCINAALYGHNEVYIGASPASFSNKEVADLVAASVADCQVSYQGEDKSPSSVYDNRYTIEKLNINSFVPMADGIKELINE